MNSFLWASAPLLRYERLLHISMASLMLLGVAGSYFLRSAIAQNADRLAFQVKECNAFCQLEMDFKDKIVNAQIQLEQLEHEYQTTIARIPTKLDDSEVLSSVRGMAQVSQCSLIDFRPIATLKQDDFQTRSFDLRLEGGFKNLFQFFESLQRVPYIYQVSRARVTEPSGPAGTCRFELELKVVFDHAWTNRE